MAGSTTSGYYFNLSHFNGTSTATAGAPGWAQDDCPVERLFYIYAGTSTNSAGQMVTGKQHEFTYAACLEHGMCQFAKCKHCGRPKHVERGLTKEEQEEIDLLLRATV